MTGAAGVAAIAAAWPFAAAAVRPHVAPPALEGSRTRVDVPPASRPAWTADPTHARPDVRDALARMAGWTAILDRVSGRPVRLHGPGVPAGRDPSALRGFGESFLAAHAVLHGGATLRAGTPVALGREDRWLLPLEQTWQGLPVEGARADLRFVRPEPGGEVLLVSARFALGHGIALDPRPTVAEEEAVAAAARAIREDGWSPHAEPRVDRARPLSIVRDGDRWALAWNVGIGRVDPPGSLSVWVDAHRGGVVAVRDGYRRADTVLQVTGSWEPRRAGDPMLSGAFPELEVRSGLVAVAVTDSAGAAVVDVPVGGSTYALALEGPYSRVRTAAGSGATAAVDLQPGVNAAFAWDDATSLLVERDAFQSHRVVRARMKRMAPDLAWLDEQVGLVVEVPDSQGCNAFWDGSEASFFMESAACNATGRVADVVYHELGHGLQQHLSATGFTAGDVGEGSSDYLAATITGDPDIGPSFFKSEPEGIRNLEPDLRYPDDATGQIHHDGQIWGGAFWDLRTSMIALLGSAEGVAWTDGVFADTLRAGPTLEDGFWDVLFAADDDGNLANGVPHECAIVEAFGRHGLGPGDALVIAHVPLGLQPSDRGGYRVRAHLGPAHPRCSDTGSDTAELEWRLAGGGSWNVVPMADDLVPGWKAAVVPGQPAGSAVEYRLRAVDTLGRTVTAPAHNFETQPFRMRVGEVWTAFSDDFEEDLGWTHELVSGPSQEGADDWQRGAPTGASGDPAQAFSGTTVWGNDLGVAPYNGAYQAGIHNRLRSPEIDCRRCRGARLQFRRWLNVESGDEDRARVLVNGEVVWENPIDETLRDGAWRFEDVEIGHVADGRRVRVSFELQSGYGTQLGGWTLDDVAVVASGIGAPASGGCGCRLDQGGAGRRGATVSALLGLFAGSVFLGARRRRRIA